MALDRDKMEAKKLIMKDMNGILLTYPYDILLTLTLNPFISFIMWSGNT